MNSNDFIQFLQLLKVFKKEVTVMKPLRFWAIYFALTGTSLLYLLPRFLEALK